MTKKMAATQAATIKAIARKLNLIATAMEAQEISEMEATNVKDYEFAELAQCAAWSAAKKEVEEFHRTCESHIQMYHELNDKQAMNKNRVHDALQGMEDCKLGIYDKWFRYHRSDDGAAYDKGWTVKTLPPKTKKSNSWNK